MAASAVLLFLFFLRAFTLLLILSSTFPSSSIAVTAAPTTKQSKLVTEGVCSIRFILRNKYLHNLKGSGDDNNLLETVLELSKMAKGMLEQDKKLEELEDNGHNTTDVLTSRLMIEYVIKDYCFWVNSALDENINCSNYESIITFVTQMSLLESVEKTCMVIKTYTQQLQGNTGINYCSWMFCNLNSECNPRSSPEIFTSLKYFAPFQCQLLWQISTCSSCSVYRNSVTPAISSSYSSPSSTATN